MEKRYLFNTAVILIMMIFSNNLHSQDNKDFSVFEEKFTEANNLYNNSKYEKSIEIYF